MPLKRDVSLKDALRYQGHGPMLTYWLHRIGGLSMVIFISLHVLAGYMLNQPWGARAGVLIDSVYENWIFQLFIFFCILFHIINGLRISILDLWPRLIEYQREAIWLEWMVFIPIYGIAIYTIVQNALGG